MPEPSETQIQSSEYYIPILSSTEFGDESLRIRGLLESIESEQSNLDPVYSALEILERSHYDTDLHPILICTAADRICRWSVQAVRSGLISGPGVDVLCDVVASLKDKYEILSYEPAKNLGAFAEMEFIETLRSEFGALEIAPPIIPGEIFSLD